MLILHVQSRESSFAVVDGAYPLARIRIVVIVIPIAYTVLCPVEMVDVFCDGEASMLGELEDEPVEELPIYSAFACFPVDYEGGETGKGERAGAGDGARLVDFLMLVYGYIAERERIQR